MVTPDPRAEERVGSVLHDKWTLERLLGEGGMGAVYAARHRNGARAAVKVLSPSMGRLPHIRKRFIQEGYAANRVDHAGAVKVLDDDVIQDGTDEGTAYLVMELLDGESLGERVKREPALTERELLELADGVLSVLEAAHKNGVVHRDLKPDNLFLARDAETNAVQIKVLDFGLARLLEAQDLTLAGVPVGTPTYMAPEQASGHVDKIDGRTDIYALGSILFQLATHKRIHDAAHTLGLVMRMATTPAPKIRSVAPDVTESFARIVDRALAFERDDRYPSASAMRSDVQAALSAYRPTTPVPVLSETKVEVRSERPTRPTRSERPARPVRRRSRAWLVLLALLGGFGALWWRQQLAGEDTPTRDNPRESVDAAPVVEAAAPIDASPTEDASVAIEDASALALVSEIDEPMDASADASDEDEEDDDDTVDASASAPSASASVAPRPGARPAAKPIKKKRPPRKPGQPRRKRRRYY